MRDARPSIPGIEIGELRQTTGRLAVYDAIDRSTGRPVVVSSIAPGDDDYLELVIAHQRALQGVASATVQRVLDTGIDASGLGYVVAEKVEGESLDTIIGDRSARGGELARLTGIAEAVRVLHDHDLAHGALAPHNVVVRPDGTMVLLNAGLAGYVDGSASIYQPEEQALRPRPVVADDIFALGAMGWWLQSGITPDKPGTLGAPDHVEAALRRALDREAGDRQWTVQEFLYELEHTVDEQRSFIPRASEPSELPPAELRARPLPILLGAAGVLALLFAAFTVFRPSSPTINTEVLGVTTVPTTEEPEAESVTTRVTTTTTSATLQHRHLQHRHLDRCGRWNQQPAGDHGDHTGPSRHHPGTGGDHHHTHHGGTDDHHHGPPERPHVAHHHADDSDDEATPPPRGRPPPRRRRAPPRPKRQRRRRPPRQPRPPARRRRSNPRPPKRRRRKTPRRTRCFPTRRSPAEPPPSPSTTLRRPAATLWVRRTTKEWHVERDSEENSPAVASGCGSPVDAGAVDQSKQETTRLRSALFGATASGAEDASESSAQHRVLARNDRPVRKRTASELGNPKGKRSLNFGR